MPSARICLSETANLAGGSAAPASHTNTKATVNQPRSGRKILFFMVISGQRDIGARKRASKMRIMFQRPTTQIRRKSQASAGRLGLSKKLWNSGCCRTPQRSRGSDQEGCVAGRTKSTFELRGWRGAKDKPRLEGAGRNSGNPAHCRQRKGLGEVACRVQKLVLRFAQGLFVRSAGIARLVPVIIIDRASKGKLAN